MPVRSMRGQAVDMDRLRSQNSKQVALNGLPKGRNGNTMHSSMNARGDILDQNGKVLIPREQIAQDYNRKNPKAVKQVSLNDIKREMLNSAMTPAEVIAKQKEINAKQKQQTQQVQQNPQRKRKMTDTD